MGSGSDSIKRGGDVYLLPLSYLKTFLLWFTLFFIFTIFVGINLSHASQRFNLSKEHIKKIERLANNISEDIASRGIKSIILKDFVDLKGRTRSLERTLTRRFRENLIKAAKGRFRIVKTRSEFVIKGTTLPYKEKERFDLRIEILSGTEVISSYSAIFKEWHR